MSSHNLCHHPWSLTSTLDVWVQFVSPSLVIDFSSGCLGAVCVTAFIIELTPRCLVAMHVSPSWVTDFNSDCLFAVRVTILGH